MNSERLALAVGNQYAVLTLRNLAIQYRTEVIEDVVHQTGAGVMVRNSV